VEGSQGNYQGEAGAIPWLPALGAVWEAKPRM